MRSAADVLQAMVDAFRSGDVSQVEDYVAADYHDHQGLDGLAVFGPEGFVRVVRAARTSFVTLDVDIGESDTDGANIEARLRWRGLRADGSVDERETIDRLHVRGGLAVAHWGRPL